MPKVSVIIPAYNAMTFLPETIDSVWAQTFTDYEIILVNDGSSDDIEAWANQITDRRLRLISQTNQGLAAARNTGLAVAQGDYVAFLDSDDLWQPTKLAKQVEMLDAHPEVALVYAWVAIVDENAQPIGKVLANCAEGDVWETLLTHNIVENGSVAMVRRTCLAEAGAFDVRLPASYGEDWDMWLRIARRHPFRVIPEVLIGYRSHSQNLSKAWMAMEASHQLIIEKAFADASADRQHLKAKTYAHAYLNIAWKALQNLGGDYRTAIHYRQQAISHDRQIRHSPGYARLSFAIQLMRWLGQPGYERAIGWLRRLRLSSPGKSGKSSKSETLFET